MKALSLLLLLPCAAHAGLFGSSNRPSSEAECLKNVAVVAGTDMAVRIAISYCRKLLGTPTPTPPSRPLPPLPPGAIIDPFKSPAATPAEPVVLTVEEESFEWCMLEHIASVKTDLGLKLLASECRK